RVTPRADHDTYGVKWINRLALGGQDLALGLDAWRRIYDGARTRRFKDGRVVQDEPLPDATYDSAGVFAEAERVLAGGLRLQAGGRLDGIRVENDASERWAADEEDETSWNAHAGAAWILGGGWSVKAVGAAGYRAASLEERFQYLDLGDGRIRLGNPELDPERSWFGECGATWTGERGALAVSAFRHELRDLIAETAVDAVTLVNENIAKARLYGMEAEGRWRPAPAWEWHGNVAWTVGRDRETGAYLGEVPPVNGLAGCRWGGARGPWAGLDVVFAARQDHVPPDVPEAPGWARVDLGAGWRFGRGDGDGRLTVRCANVFDKTYRDYLTTYRGNVYNEPGRAVTVGYEAAF
ncbi:MAG: TonB-dependent receptor, partial [Lentisphaerae bacterium]|nr:TonB-dependent receptor [Lentisphaerota bacterium]